MNLIHEVHKERLSAETNDVFSGVITSCQESVGVQKFVKKNLIRRRS